MQTRNWKQFLYALKVSVGANLDRSFLGVLWAHACSTHNSQGMPAEYDSLGVSQLLCTTDLLH